MTAEEGLEAFDVAFRAAYTKGCEELAERRKVEPFEPLPKESAQLEVKLHREQLIDGHPANFVHLFADVGRRAAFDGNRKDRVAALDLNPEDSPAARQSPHRRFCVVYLVADAPRAG